MITQGNLHGADVTVKNRLYVGGDFLTNLASNTLTAFSIDMPNGITLNGPAGGVGHILTLNADSLFVDFDADASDANVVRGINGINLDSGNDNLQSVRVAGGDGGTLNIGTTTTPIENDVTINRPISANVSGTARAERGTVEITNNGSNGVVNVTNATLHGNTVQAGALGANGTLNVRGGTISADSTIMLYAGGSNGTVNFTDNVTLSGNSVKTIAGNTVTIFDGKVVTVSGPAPASVFTNNPNYTGSGGNGSTTGTFGGRGATTSPLGNGPGRD